MPVETYFVNYNSSKQSLFFYFAATSQDLQTCLDTTPLRTDIWFCRLSDFCFY